MNGAPSGQIRQPARRGAAREEATEPHSARAPARGRSTAAAWEHPLLVPIYTKTREINEIRQTDDRSSLSRALDSARAPRLAPVAARRCEPRGVAQQRARSAGGERGAAPGASRSGAGRCARAAAAAAVAERRERGGAGACVLAEHERRRTRRRRVAWRAPARGAVPLARPEAQASARLRSAPGRLAAHVTTYSFSLSKRVSRRRAARRRS
jgi:hypothetical protein